jgi:hypothetical protein
MTQTNFVRTSLTILTGLAAVLFLAMPASAGPRGQSGGGRQTSSHPAPSGGGGSARPAPSGGGSSGGSNGGGQSAPAPRAVPRGSDGTTSGTRDTSAGSGGATTSAGSTGATASRPTSNRTAASGAVVGHAAAGTAGTTVVVPNGYYGGFYPWGYAGLGFGGYYAGYYGYYDPWIDGGGYYGQPYTTSGYDDGLLRLKVKPRDGMVYVDGFFAGIVDDFDGIFQHLHIEAGAHHVEIMADGYEPLEINVQIQRGRTVTYSGDLKKIQ